ncbi:hypothetical protein HXX76_013086 [Chlamydomonas incerta]|uniref:Glycoside-hydrolase family GH114 TIM-barrel domain-containing protein n=1 Tax=Chlamydomonas incerta TaxID=51695 RepID=A0A835VUU4_CHLIN|nr:hypothetical protein HXX76_013086 [Chlamydomonas incerta]|eukprot:KAG2426329.1 hypothetical protein HXX76_013086 [Chlamydomonas incerta]
MGVFLPWYVFPDTAAYSALAAYGPRCAIHAIVTGDDSGPPRTDLATYITEFKRLADSGIRLYGYVHTLSDVAAHVARPLADVTADIAAWYGPPGLAELLSGVFLDEVDPALSNAKAVDYYRQLADAVQGRGGRVVFNPGSQIGCSLAALADVYVRYEDYAADWAPQLGGGMRCECAAQSSCAALLHGLAPAAGGAAATAAALSKIVSQADSRAFSYVFVTDRVMPDPWDGLPSYFNALMDTVAPWQLSGNDFRPLLRSRPEVIDVDIDSVGQLLQQAAEVGVRRQDFKLICYFSAGTYEPARAADDLAKRQVSWPDLEAAAAAAAAAAGLSVGAGGGARPGPLYLQSMDPPFGEELWLAVDLPATRQLLVDKVMIPRMKYAVAEGCDGVELDNVDAYDNVSPAAFKALKPAQRPARGVTPEQQLQYNGALLDAAHGLRLSAGLKNALDLLGRSFADGRRVSDAYDWFLNERCWEFDECDAYGDNIRWPASIMAVEYCDSVRRFGGAGSQGVLRPDCVCPLANAFRGAAGNCTLSHLIKTVDLQALGLDCRAYCATPGVNCVPPAGGKVSRCLEPKSVKDICPRYGITGAAKAPAASGAPPPAGGGRRKPPRRRASEYANEYEPRVWRGHEDRRALH